VEDAAVTAFPDDDATLALVVVCTDAGQHGAVELARIMRNIDRTLVALPVVHGSKGKATVKPGGFKDTPLGRREFAAYPDMYEGMQKVAEPVKTETGWRFGCRRCGRDVPFSSGTLAKIVSLFERHDKPFDVSARL